MSGNQFADKVKPSGDSEPLTNSGFLNEAWAFGDGKKENRNFGNMNSRGQAVGSEFGMHQAVSSSYSPTATPSTIMNGSRMSMRMSIGPGMFLNKLIFILL